MIDINIMHPVVRFGIAAAYVTAKEADMSFDIQSEAELFSLAEFAVANASNGLVLKANPGSTPETLIYKPLSFTDLTSKGGGKKNAANGFFTAPHVLTSNNISDLIKEINGISIALKKKDYDKNYELKRSFAPMISKINAGKKSLSNPRISLLEAAFTLVAAITPYKPAAFVKEIGDKFSNAAIIPDLPFYSTGSNTKPMIEFVSLFYRMQKQGLGSKAFVSNPTKAKKFPRPEIFYGNYPNRPKSFGLGIISVVAAIGKWTEEHEDSYSASEEVLQLLQNRPLYLISYNNIGQQKFNHHLVQLSLSGSLYRVLEKLPIVSLYGVDKAKKFSSPKWSLFLIGLDNFLRFFNESSWRNFLSVRATYPIEFFQLFKTYFNMANEGKYPKEVITAAVAYGESLNRAAFNAAAKETGEDEKKDFKGRELNEYKQRTLLQFESIISGAKTNQDLIARLNSQVGRFTVWDISAEAKPFLIAVANDEIELKDAKDLITAFMRLSTYKSDNQ